MAAAMNQLSVSHTVNGSSPPGWYTGVSTKFTAITAPTNTR